jgi:hypothetical protein
MRAIVRRNIDVLDDDRKHAIAEVERGGLPMNTHSMVTAAINMMVAANPMCAAQFSRSDLKRRH